MSKPFSDKWMETGSNYYSNTASDFQEGEYKVSDKEFLPDLCPANEWTLLSSGTAKK